MNSMTGYGKAELNGDYSLTIEIKTVNNRYLDVNIKTPRGFLEYEDVIRKTVQKNIARGRVDVFVTFRLKAEGAAAVTADAALAKSYVLAAAKIAEATGLENDLTVSSLLRVPGVIETEENAGNPEELKENIEKLVDEACRNLNDMRQSEGKKLIEDALIRVDVVESELKKIENRAPLLAAEYRAKLKLRMDEILSSVEVDEGKLLNEVAFFTDRSNIDEEITRLKSHISQFRKIVKGERFGRQLDFLVQEFNREANTICSKSSDTDITACALILKSEIEKIREQIQNLE